MGNGNSMDNLNELKLSNHKSESIQILSTDSDREYSILYFKNLVVKKSLLVWGSF